jgi:Flp pilus assembly protein TadD
MWKCQPKFDFMQSRSIKRVLLVASFLSLLLLGGAYSSYHKYVSLRQERLIHQARHYLAQSDTARAQLCLRGALGHNSKDLEACRLMAQLAEASHSPDALSWRARVVELNPGSLNDRLDLAQTAMMLRDFVSATSALAEVLPEDKNTAAYHNMAGAVAAADNQLAQAEEHFLQAARLEPGDMSIQLSLAVVRLHGTNTTALANARAMLRLLASSPTNSSFRCQALRELVVDAVRCKQAEAALAWSGELLQQTNSVFKDRFLRLEVLRETGDAGFKPELAVCQREAAQEQDDLYDLATWEMGKLSPRETLAWLQNVPANMQTNQPVALLMAECDTMVEDWCGLQCFLKHQNWADLEFIRHAFEARALRGQGLAAFSKVQWEQALKFANGRKANLGTLLRLAAQWNWPKEAEDILWTIVNKYPDEKWAFETLAQTLFIDGQTRSLMQLCCQEAKQTPSDLAAKNNLAITALLLDAQELKPQELARELYQKEPANSAYASTYAFALYMQKDNTEALKVLEQLNSLELEKPSVSGCYGLVLQAAGNGTKARRYLDISSSAWLLPEERQLIEKAKAGI